MSYIEKPYIKINKKYAKIYLILILTIVFFDVHHL